MLTRFYRMDVFGRHAAGMRRTAQGYSLGLLVAGVLSCVVLGGCSQGRREAGPVFPAPVTQAAVLDIQVLRDADTITLTNVTARSFGPSRLWANRWYSREIEGLGAGQTLVLSLSEFVDAHGETFKGGGFFAADKPDALAQLQLEEDGKFYGLIVASRGEY